MKNVLILGAGILIGYMLFRKSIQETGVSIVKPGDKSKEIEGMQKAFEKIGTFRFDEYGQYDADTLAVVQYLLNGSTSLKNESGHLDSRLVSDLSVIYYNTLKN
jgi:hypothetical protein